MAADASSVFAFTEQSHIKGHQDYVIRAKFSKTGRLIVSAGYNDKTARVWNVGADHECTTLIEVEHKVWDASLSADELHLALALGDGSAQVYTRENDDPATPFPTEPTKTLKLHSADCNAASFSLDNNWLVTSADDELIMVVHLPTETTVAVEHVHSGYVLSLKHSFDGSWLASGGRDSMIGVFRFDDTVARKSHLYLMKQHGKLCASDQFEARNIEPSPDRLPASPYTHMLNLTGHSSSPWALSFHPHADILASGSNDKTCRLWNLNTGACLHVFNHDSMLFGVTFGPKGDYIITGSRNRHIAVWDLDTSERKIEFDAHEERVRGLDLSEDGRTLLSCSWDHTMKTWLLPSIMVSNHEMREFVLSLASPESDVSKHLKGNTLFDRNVLQIVRGYQWGGRSKFVWEG